MLDRRRFVQSLLALAPRSAMTTLTTRTAAAAKAASPATGTGGGAPAAPPGHAAQGPYFRSSVAATTAAPSRAASNIALWQMRLISRGMPPDSA